MPSKGEGESAASSPGVTETPKKARSKKPVGSAKKRKVSEDDEEQDVKAESDD